MILVTGGAGFIGSNLVGRLLTDGHDVVVVDSIENEVKSRNLALFRDLEVAAPRDLGDILARRADDVRLVYHLGAITSTFETDVELLTETNVRLSQRLWRWCHEHDVPLVYASSAATYGDGEWGFRDDDSVDALGRLRPLNAYAQSKHAFDQWAARQALEGMAPPSWHGLKYFNVYGPNEGHKGPMRSLVAKAYPKAARGEPVALFRSHRPGYENGGQKRDFVYVRDCVEATLWIAERRPKNGIYNVGTGRAQSWLDLIHALFAALGKEPLIEWEDIPAEIRDRYQYFTEADISKLRGVGFHRPFWPVEDGVRDYVHRYLMQNPPR
jgi:ADP-L-glycero-D-manno-heptose 6-epimerase